jgi:hypothetical protein
VTFDPNSFRIFSNLASANRKKIKPGTGWEYRATVKAELAKVDKENPARRGFAAIKFFSKLARASPDARKEWLLIGEGDRDWLSGDVDQGNEACVLMP